MTKLIGLGASTMQGVGDSHGGFFTRLESKLVATGKPRYCINLGIGGNTTRDMLERFDLVRPHLPSATIVMLGCNDLPRECDAAPQNRIQLSTYTSNLATIFAELQHPETIFVSSFRVNPQLTGIKSETFAEYMNAALKIAASLNLSVWNLYAESAVFGDKYLAADGLHYNDFGHEFIAERLCGMIVNSRQ